MKKGIILNNIRLILSFKLSSFAVDKEESKQITIELEGFN
jgi:hypothetical protein